MSNPHVPFDPDPLTPAEYRQTWIEGYDAGLQDAPRCVVVKHPTRGEWAAVVLATFALLVSAFFFGRASAAPRSATTVIPTGTPNGSASIDRTPVPSGNPSSLTGAPLVPERPDTREGNRLEASPEAPVASVSRPGGTSPRLEPDAIAGVASWYDDGPGLYAAVPSWHFGDRRYRVRVTAGDRSVVVTVRDFCGCPGHRVIDLSPAAFEALAHFTRDGRYHTGHELGLVRVTVEDLRAPRITPPPTDRE